jgi:maleylacetoacetate isomerase
VKLYDYYRSSASYRVRIALNYKNISYESIPIHLTIDGGQQFASAYKKLNPQALVPTLDENGHVLSQSLAIIEYLEEMCPTPNLLPSNPLAKAQVRSLALLIACDIHPLNNLRVLSYLRQNSFSADEQVSKWYHHWLKLGLDALENKLALLPRKNSVCYGSDISLADVCLIPQIYNAKRFNFPIENYPIIEDIYNYCDSLNAFKHASPDFLANKEIPPKQEFPEG